MKQTVQSDAFHRASLKSEGYRIIGILIVLGLIAALAVVRVVVRPRAHDGEWLRFALPGLGVVAGYEAAMLVLTRRAGKRDRAVGTWVWVLNTVVECALPTVALVGLTQYESLMGPYRALVSPTVVIYGFLIILSTLRLNPWLCVLAGALSAAGYAGVFVYTGLAYPSYRNRLMMPAETFAIYPVLIFCGGLIAAGVARQIRRHVIAALAEAETKRRLERMEQDLTIARTIQMGLLPKRAPAVEGYSIAGWIQPADQTGGDYYDWIELPDGKVMLTIADATGHGIGPALLVAACRAYFRAIATHDDPLEKITAQVDALIAEDVTDGRFITAAVALLEPKAHRLSLYSAGHGPQYLYVAKRDAVEQFGADQPPLGICIGDHGACARVIEMEEGDAVVLVTDGMFECENAGGEMMGTARLAEAICGCRGKGAEEVIGRLRDGVAGFSGSVVQGDDRTVVVVRRSGKMNDGE